MATTKTVRLQDFGKEIRKDTKIRLKEQRKAVERGLLRSLPRLVESSPVDTGQYAASWDFTVDEKRAIIGNFAPHAPIIEIGARPFTPPIRPLLAWAKRVLRSGSQPPDYDSEVWALARGVQKKIAAEGMAPRKVLEKNLPMIIANVRAELKKLE